MNKSLDFIEDQYPDMVKMLYRFAEINTGSENLAGLANMLKVLHEVMLSLSDDIQILTPPPYLSIGENGKVLQKKAGNVLWARKRPNLKRRILLCGHMDTVYSEQSDFQTLTHLSENVLKGPGVTDMKGGLVVLIHTLHAFEKFSQNHSIGWDVFINADEEIGSLSSRSYFNKLANHSQVALIFEPAAKSDGTLAKNRKGSAKATLVAHGKSAHAGRAFHEGANAICYLAEVVLAIHQLNTKRKGVTLNVGLIRGGEALNQVPDKAIAKIDIRIENSEDEHWVKKEFSTIARRFKYEPFKLDIHLDFGRPVKKTDSKTERLFALLKHLGQGIHLDLNWEDSGGCCDGNNFAALGLPVIDTLGVRGGHIHSPEEYIFLDSLVERTKLNTLLLQHLAQGELEKL